MSFHLLLENIASFIFTKHAFSVVQTSPSSDNVVNFLRLHTPSGRFPAQKVSFWIISRHMLVSGIWTVVSTTCFWNVFSWTPFSVVLHYPVKWQMKFCLRFNCFLKYFLLTWSFGRSLMLNGKTAYLFEQPFKYFLCFNSNNINRAVILFLKCIYWIETNTKCTQKDNIKRQNSQGF